MKQLNYRKLKKALKLLVAVSITILGASQVYAQELMHPGSMCVRYDGSNAISHTYSTIGNRSSTNWLYVYCPIVRKSFNSYNTIGGRIASGRMRVNDGNPNYGVSCILYSMWRYYGGQSYLSYVSKTGPAETGVRDLPFGSLNSTAPSVYYYYVCSIPPMYNGAVSEVVWYAVEERS